MSRLRPHSENHLVNRIGWMRAAVLGVCVPKTSSADGFGLGRFHQLFGNEHSFIAAVQSRGSRHRPRTGGPPGIP